jgi:hypothetical protein
MVLSCADDDADLYHFDVTISNDLDVDIYVTDPKPDIIDILINNYHLESGEWIWLTWSTNDIFLDRVEIEAYHRFCYVHVTEGINESVSINDAWIDEYCPE